MRLLKITSLPDTISRSREERERSRHIHVVHHERRDIRRMVEELIGRNACDFVSSHVDIYDENNFLVSTTARFNILRSFPGNCNNIVNLRRVNDIRYLNKFFEAVNERLRDGGLFIGMAETKDIRKARIFKRYPRGLNYLVYTLDFAINRVMPKVGGLKKLYFSLTRGHNRVLTRPEILGRLISCGFEIVEEQEIDQMFYWVVRRNSEPAYDYNPTYGPLIRLKRVGKGGEMIEVYKFRTMHPYSEYLQNYLFDKNNLDKDGKFRDDYRVTTFGRFMRRFWIDELPMLINLLMKRNMKLVGVRPLSRHYYSLYTPELQNHRVRHKPGLLPPYYADMPAGFQEIMDSEKRYLESYEKQPFLTDLRYFFIILFNILVYRVRSK
ncbi:MAG TPA: sugar transferase [Bacteroidales bacterium]|nr:sugar transferase [Bacteroidales bacterium]HSA44456.1 sugar transferase [Bacteroidales bacterium]